MMFETMFLRETECHYHKEGQHQVTSEDYTVRILTVVKYMQCPPMDYCTLLSALYGSTVDNLNIQLSRRLLQLFNACGHVQCTMWLQMNSFRLLVLSIIIKQL